MALQTRKTLFICPYTGTNRFNAEDNSFSLIFLLTSPFLQHPEQVLNPHNTKYDYSTEYK